MAQGIENVARNAIERIGFIVEPDAKTDLCLKHLLVQFKKSRSKLTKLTVPPKPSFLSRYYYCLFIMSVVAYRRFYWEHGKEPGWPKKEPIDFPLTANVGSKEMKRERFLYRFLVNYYFNLMRSGQDRYRSLRSNPESRRLRDNIISIFKPTDHQGEEWGVERGKAIDLKLDKKKVDNTIYFWNKDDFPGYNFDDPNLKQINITGEGLPVTSIPGPVLDRLLDHLRKSDFWKNWKDAATKKHRAIRGEGSTEELLRSHLKNEAVTFLSKKLHGRNDDYQSLELEAGYIPENAEINEIDKMPDRWGRDVPKHNRQWRAFNWRLLFDSTDVYILSSDLGTGKTTFLRYLQKAVLQKPQRLAIFLSASKIEKWDFTDKDSFIDCLSKEFQPWLPKSTVVRFLKNQLDHNILILVDGLDQIEGVGTEYQRLLDKLFRIMPHSLIVASRPFAVTSHEDDPRATFLRLRPFSLTTQKEYFGDTYARACQICRDDRTMLSLPILATMLRTLIRKHEDNNIVNRHDLYKRFCDYIFYRYKHEGLGLSRRLRDEVRMALQKISYDAIASGKIRAERIPLSFCRNCIADLRLRIEIDDLPRCGFVEFIVEKTTGDEEFLLFSHQSFQQYLAAEWASGSDERISYLIKNNWNPKWREVIRFLAGRDGDRVVERIYAGVGHDDVIHSQLLLAAECAGEMKSRSQLTSELCKELIELASKPLFELDALRALVRLDTDDVHERTWQSLKKRIWEAFVFDINDPEVLSKGKGDGRIYGIVTDPEVIKALYTPERLRWACENARARDAILPLRAITQWRDNVDGTCIDEVITGSLAHMFTSTARLAAIRELEPRLRPDHVETLEAMVASLDPRVQCHGLRCLAEIPQRLACPQLSRIVDCSQSTHDFVAAAACRTIACSIREIPRPLFDRLLDIYLGSSPDNNTIIYGLSKPLGEHLERADQYRIFNALRTDEGRLKKRALLLLQSCRMRLDEKFVGTIMSYLRDRYLRRSALVAVARQCRFPDSKYARQLLDEIMKLPKDQRAHDAGVVFEHLGHIVSSADIDKVMDCLDGSEGASSACWALSYVADKLTDRQLRTVLDALLRRVRGLDWFDVVTLLFERYATHLLERYARHLRDSNARYVLNCVLAPKNRKLRL